MAIRVDPHDLNHHSNGKYRLFQVQQTSSSPTKTKMTRYLPQLLRFWERGRVNRGFYNERNRSFSMLPRRVLIVRNPKRGKFVECFQHFTPGALNPCKPRILPFLEEVTDMFQETWIIKDGAGKNNSSFKCRYRPSVIYSIMYLITFTPSAQEMFRTEKLQQTQDAPQKNINIEGEGRRMAAQLLIL